MAFRNLDEFLAFQEEKMLETGFNAAKIDLCISDMRTGAITLLEVARHVSRDKSFKGNQVSEFFFALEAWVEGRKRQRRV